MQRVRATSALHSLPLGAGGGALPQIVAEQQLERMSVRAPCRKTTGTAKPFAFNRFGVCTIRILLTNLTLR